MNILLVGAGGFLGAIARYLFSLLIVPINNFPVATLVVNIIGCLLAGIFFGSNIDNKESVYYFFSIGFLGSFTTMSAFALQAIELHQSNQLFASYSYILITILLTIIATIVGINISKQC